MMRPYEIGAKRCKELALQHIQEICRQPTEAGKAKKRTEFGMKEGKNPILQLSLNPFQ